MRQVRVIAGEGAVVRGPARVQITGPQMLGRTAVLGARWRRGGVFEIPAAQAVTFDKGEVLGVSDPGPLADQVEPVGWSWDELAPAVADDTPESDRPKAAAKTSTPVTPKGPAPRSAG